MENYDFDLKGFDTIYDQPKGSGKSRDRKIGCLIAFQVINFIFFLILLSVFLSFNFYLNSHEKGLSERSWIWPQYTSVMMLGGSEEPEADLEMVVKNDDGDIQICSKSYPNGIFGPGIEDIRSIINFIFGQFRILKFS